MIHAWRDKQKRNKFYIYYKEKRSAVWGRFIFEFLNASEDQEEEFSVASVPHIGSRLHK